MRLRCTSMADRRFHAVAVDRDERHGRHEFGACRRPRCVRRLDLRRPVAAEAAQGFIAFAASISRDAPLDWAVALTFESEDLLHLWLDGATWKHLVRGAAGRGFLRLTSDLVIVDGAVIPSGAAIVSSSVSSGMEADFQAAHVKLTTGRRPVARLRGNGDLPAGRSGAMEFADPVSHRTPVVGVATVPAAP